MSAPGVAEGPGGARDAALGVGLDAGEGADSDGARREICARSAGKLDEARREIAALGGALIAFSGGADSALVVRLARDVLGGRAVALTAVSASLPPGEREAAEVFCRDLGVRHVIALGGELSDPRYAKNPEDRCYFCKTELFALCGREAARLGLPYVLDGFNADDRRAHRPGRRAGVEHGVRSPLAEAGLGKEEIRAHSWALGLATWDKPAAPCLASRIPFGTEITADRLARVGGAEAALRELGFSGFRVRFHGEIARLEVSAEDFSRLLDPRLRREVARRVEAQGFRFVAVDLAPFASGRLSAAREVR